MVQPPSLERQENGVEVNGRLWEKKKEEEEDASHGHHGDCHDDAIHAETATETDTESEQDGSDGYESSEKEAESESESSAGEEGEHAESVAKKKKKKKKNKKKGKKDGEVSRPVPSADDRMLPADVADARYAAALEGLRANDEACLWVQLGKCRLGDKKARKLADVIMENRTVTSIDLSDNTISDDGIQQLTTVLASGAAPDLIQLDVRGNQISEKGKMALLSLQKIRKLVKVDFMEVESEPNSSKLDVWNEALPQNGWGADTNGWSAQVGGRNAATEKMKIGNPQERIDSALKAIKDSQHALNVAELTSHIEVVMAVLLRELQEEQHKTYAATAVDGLPQALKLVSRNLSKFVGILDLCPPSVECQRKLLEAAVGRHRIATIQLLYRLSIPCNRCIDEQLISTKAVSKLLHMLFQFPWNSSLHCAIYRFFQVVLSRPSSPLADHLLDGSEGLLARLAHEGSGSCKLRIGRRLGYTGHVLQLSRLLLEQAAKHPSLKEKLDAHAEWSAYVGEGGAFQVHKEQQDGFLGGSKPDAPVAAASFESEQAEVANALEQLRLVYLQRATGGSFKVAR